MSKKKLSPDEKARLEEIGQRIVSKMQELDEIVEIDGTPTLTIKRHTGEYRKKGMMHGSEFFFHDSYVGNRGHLIFVLEPVEWNEEFQYLEVASFKEIDNAMPLMAGKIAAAFNLGEIEKIGHVIQLIEGILHDEQKQEEKEAEVAAQNNPIWGMF